MRTIIAVSIAGAVLLITAVQAGAVAPLRCSTPGPGCCAAQYGPGGPDQRTCDATVGTTFPSTRRNILFVLADDLAYCHAGFMVTRGVCSDTSKLCASDAECPGGRCHFELTCRNRRPGVSESGVDEPFGGKDAGAFPYDRDQGDSTTLPAKTPFLDDLAGHGAVFPRAHVAASTCTSSRQTFLTGRYQRHSSYLNGGGNAELECVQPNGMSAATPKGCFDDDDCDGDDVCAPVRTMPRLLSALTTLVYKSYGTGKVEFFNSEHGFTSVASHRKKPQIGKFRCSAQCGTEEDCGGCTPCNECRADLANDDIPEEARASVREIWDLLEQDGGQGIFQASSPTATPKQMNPFFIWYGPNIPHDPGSPDRRFLEIYQTDPAYARLHQKELLHFGRISWMDFGIRTVVDYLQTACVCGRDILDRNEETGAEGPYEWLSLYDSTVVIYAGGDQGYLLPNAKHNYTENGHRMVLVVSDPAHRRGPAPLPPKVFPADFAHTSDVLQTVVAYAGVSDPVPYPYGRNLKPWVEGHETDPIRPLQYGEKGKAKVPNPGGAHYLVNRPGLVGVCAESSPPLEHARPCVDDLDCNRDDDPCLKGDETPYGKRCINLPGTACEDDDQCIVTAMCAENDHCADLSGSQPDVSFKDMHGKPCSAPADCVPAGVCRPLMLKAEANAKGQVKFVWDVNLTPDQNKKQNLLKIPGNADPGYLGPCIRTLIEKCLYRFRKFEPLSAPAALPAPPAGCSINLTALENKWCPEP